MLIKRPVSEVFNAFIDPAITSKVWFTKSSGKLRMKETISWTWEMFDHTVEILVKSIVPNERIQIQWGENKNALVTWGFKEIAANRTFVTITNTGFIGAPEEVIAQIRDATEGFALVLANLKAYLEHNIELQLINDRYPKT